MATSDDVVVVMVPFVAQGHLNQLLHFSHLIISGYNIPIHFVCTATHSRQARLRLQGRNTPNNHMINFHQIPDPEFTSPPPNPNGGPTQCLTHLQPSFNATLLLRHPVADIIRSLSKTTRRVAVVHDSLMSYVVQDVKTIPNAETYIFRGLSVFFTFCLSFEKLGKEIPKSIRQLPKPVETMSQEFLEFVKLQFLQQSFHVGNIYDSSRVVEGKFLESLEKEETYGKNHWAVGPFNPVEIESNSTDSLNRHNCLKWLDKQPANSVVYVSFGTTTTFTNDQINELAIGLEKSEQRFLWVLREADKGDIFKKSDDKQVELPDGFEERVAGKGLVVREWAPQLEILGHSSTGGFVSHCGWNSCMEALTSGVAIATWPMHTDQPYNAVLLLDELGVALVMRDWARKDELLASDIVENVVRKLMVTSEGAAIRKKAKELGGQLRMSVAKDGVTRKELDSIISYFRR
ncbi:zeatin O-glucosyltransferase-like [Rutidosis leptorrhynchoides]|uniref:zeatin O-glucosyltransferase-like n=1 Tax=Rutidosis leptorrhynchoides TaxID=125765 RepID=UPI003A990E45